MSENNALNSLKENEKNTILACEIAGYLHDLGKLHYGFMGDSISGCDKFERPKGVESSNISNPHGAILELGRHYPNNLELENFSELNELLNCLKNNEKWASILKISEYLCKDDTIQATGLGATIRQHHANSKFPENELSLLGDIYSFCADIRDSALDKGSGNTETGKQVKDSAEMINSFGLHKSEYSKEILENSWKNVVSNLYKLLTDGNATNDVLITRNKVLKNLKNDFLNALGETRRPTNDVPLQNHAYSTASFFKAAIAEGFLRQDFKLWQEQKSGLFDLSKLGLIRFRLLGIRWNWQQLIKGLLSPVAMISLSEIRREVIEKLQVLFEQKSVIGNLIYKDDNGALFLLPGFYEGSIDDNKKQAEVLFKEKVLTDEFLAEINIIISELGTGTAYNLYWTEPTLYLTDYAEALGLKNNADSKRVLYCQANENALRELWNKRNNSAKNLQHICPQCGIRPANTFEFDYNQSKVKDQPLCSECTLLSNDEARKNRKFIFEEQFGFKPKSLDLSNLVKNNDNNSRVAIFSVQVNAEQIANGNALITQLARPIDNITVAHPIVYEVINEKDEFKKILASIQSERHDIKDNSQLGDWFQSVFDDLKNNVKINNKIDKRFNVIEKLNNEQKNSAYLETRAGRSAALLGDDFWLKKTDGRGEPLEVAKNFFLRESADLPAQLKLVRHDGDRLALFAMRKHTSPARLQRLWENLYELWKEIIVELGEEFKTEIIPLSLDSSGFRFVVAANNSTTTVQRINNKLQLSLNKLKGSLAAHLSCIVTNAKFPFYLALETLNKMENRITKIHYQSWTLLNNPTKDNNGFINLKWQTSQGLVNWEIDVTTSDKNQDDIWHSYFILNKRDGKEVETGPNRLVYIKDLKANDEVLIMPSTFDFMALEGTARRHQLYYNENLRRPHWVMGKEIGCTPLLLDTFNDFVKLVENAGWNDGDTNYGKAKRLMGEMVETYEKWVRDVPEFLREKGQEAWKSHLKNMLDRYCPKVDKMAKENILSTIKDGRFFDAIEWLTFIGK